MNAMRYTHNRALLGVGLVVLAGLLAACGGSGDSEEVSPSAPSAAAQPSVAPASEDLIPEIRGIEAWINSEPLTIAELRGKVVLVDFWTYTCVNCIRTLPYLKDWQSKYASRGLVILGAHSPEFEFEKDFDNVLQAVQDLGVTWPVAMDNDFETWRAYQNRFWPHKYLADAQGRLRYDHIGEGAYLETEEEIRKLLTEAGFDVSDIPLGLQEPLTAGEASAFGPRTREIYAGYQWELGGYLGNPAPGLTGGPVNFEDPGDRQNGQFYLDGSWLVGSQFISLAEPVAEYGPHIAIRYQARSVNVVLNPQGAAPTRVLVTVDEAPVLQLLAGDDIVYDEEGQSYLEVQEARMYSVIRGPERDVRELRLLPISSELQLYAYTFG